jgi:hypothetical protein
MAQSCGAENYAWTAEATTVSLIHQVIGFREQPPLAVVDDGEEQAAFMLRPALPSAWVRQPGSAGDRYSAVDLHFRGVTFTVHYTVASVQKDQKDQKEARAHAEPIDNTINEYEGGLVKVQIVEAPSAAEAKVHVEFALRNADQAVRVVVRAGQIVDIALQ